MNEIHTFVQRYGAIWNEPDVNCRRRGIVELWSDEATHYTETRAAHGHAEIETRIAEAYEQFVGTGNFVFKALDDADTHHHVVRLKWVMVTQVGGKEAAAGTVFIILGSDGRIQKDYQFTDDIQN